jgi:hypothetical protein
VAKAVAPLAKRALPKIAKALTRSTPQLTRGIGKVAKALHRNPKTRHLLRAVPGIARRTVGNIAHKVARGGQITPRTAVRTLAHQTRRVLGTPQHRAQAMRRHNHLERKFHKRIGPGMSRPHLRYGRVGTRHLARPVKPGTARSAVHPGVKATAPHAVTGATSGARYGQTVGGQCKCAACPTCGTPNAAHPNAAPVAAPAYCRCCGQVIR